MKIVKWHIRSPEDMTVKLNKEEQKLINKIVDETPCGKKAPILIIKLRKRKRRRPVNRIRW